MVHRTPGRLFAPRARRMRARTATLPVMTLQFALPFVLLLGACAAPAQPPVLQAAPIAEAAREPVEERFLGASRVQFAPVVHAERRARLAASLRASGGGVFLTPSADGFSGGETFRQLDDFLYFTGLELPNAVLAIDAESGDGRRSSHLGGMRGSRSASRPNDFPGRPAGGRPRGSLVRAGDRRCGAIDELEGAVSRTGSPRVSRCG